MFRLFGFPRPKPKKSPAPRARLWVEPLEDRWCPAAPTLAPIVATHVGNYLTINGMVMDESPGTAHVNLGGAVSAQVTPDASGYFSYVTAWPGGTQVTGTVTDAENLTSCQRTSTISAPTNANPFLVMSVTYMSGKQIQITGQMFDEAPANRVVTIAGVASGSATTNSQGQFSLTVTASQLGMIYAYATDWAGNASNTPIVTLTSAAPVIQQFTCSEQPGGWYVFSGKVTDESVQNLTVYFGGEPDSLQGQKVTVQADGWFYFRVHLSGTYSDEGTATAVVTDWWGLQSSIVMCDVHQTGVG